jgi:hypothetical protein
MTKEMNDILLTPEQRAGLIVDAVEAHAKGASIEKVLDDLVANAGRAQVRNLTTAPAFVWSDCPKWNGVMCDSFSGETVCADCWAAWNLVTNWAALKAAGGE